MALPQYYRFVLVNNSGQTLTFDSNGRINIKHTDTHENTTDGKIVYTQRADDDLGFVATGTLSDGAEIIGDVELTNTGSNLFLSAEIQIEITHDAGTLADGTFDLYVSAGDAAGALQTDASGYGSAEDAQLQLVGSLRWEPNGLDDEVMLSNALAL